MPPESMQLALEKLDSWPTAVTLSNMNEEDCPLIFVNNAFSDLTGYRQDECIGRNCRFLQGDGTDRETVRKLRHAVERHTPITTCLLNYRKDGTPFHNFLQMAPVDLTDHRHLLLGCQYEFREELKNPEIQEQLQSVAGAFHELNGFPDNSVRLFGESIRTRTESTRMMIDIYMVKQRLAS